MNEAYQACSCSLNKRSFSGSSGVGRGLDLGCRAKICARELASVASWGLHRLILASRINSPAFFFYQQRHNFETNNYFSWNMSYFEQTNHIFEANN